jgi:hypothetical protein
VEDEEDTMRCWQSKIKRLCQHLREWAKHTSGVNKKEKDLLDKLDSQDKKAETTVLTPQEVDLKRCLNTHLSELLRGEGGRGQD